MFQNPNTQSGTTPQPSSIFGSGTTTLGAGGASSGGILGGNTAANAGGATTASGGTGSNASANTIGSQQGSLFGQLNQTPAAGGGGLLGNFGSHTTQNTPNATPLFGGGGTNPLFGGKAPGSIFGGGLGSTAPAAATTQPAVTPLFGLSKPADQTAATPKPATPNFFAMPPAAAAAGTSTGTSLGTATTTPGGLFGSVKPAETMTPQTPAAPASGSNIFGAGLFGKKPETPSTGITTATVPSLSANLAAPTPTPASGAGPTPSLGGLFSGTGAKPAEKPATATPASFNLFGAPAPAATPSASKEGDKPQSLANAPPLGSTFGTSAPGTTVLSAAAQPTSTSSSSALSVSALGAPSVAVSVPAPSMLRGKTIEEIVNKWSADLETHVREFNTYAAEIAVWDRALIENGNTLAALYGHVLAAEREQNEIDQSLDHIEHQQKDLANALDVYEKSAEEILGRQGGTLRALDTGPADAERDRNYMLATDLHMHLDDLSASLTKMIESVNELSLQPTDSAAQVSAGDDPMNQISQILSSHLESLQWIDNAAREVEAKVVEVEKRVKESGVASSGLSGRLRSYGNR